MAIDGKRILVLAPKHNTGTKKDATGAFQPEAATFAKRNGVGDGPENALHRGREHGVRQSACCAGV